MIVLFDIDDTLVNHSAALRAATDVLHKNVESTDSDGEFHGKWTAALRRHFDRFLTGELSYDSQRRARVRDTIDPTLSDDPADEIFSTYLVAYEESWSLFPDVLPCLQQLSSLPLGIVSNGQGLQQRMKLERTGIAEMFDRVVISEECGSAKPSAEIFRYACSAFGHPPQEAVYVGDLYDLDAAGARNAGLTGIWLDRDGKATVEHDPPVIPSLLSLHETIETIEFGGWRTPGCIRRRPRYLIDLD